MLLLLTLLFLLGLAHPLVLASAATLTPDSYAGPVVTAVPSQQCHGVEAAGVSWGKGLVRGKGERNSIRLSGHGQPNTFLSVSLSQQSPARAHGFSSPFSLPNILAICFG